MKKIVAILMAGLSAISAHAQLTPEGIMALLPDMPSQTVMIGVATHNTEFNDRSEDTQAWEEYFVKLQEVIGQAEEAVTREQENAAGELSIEAVKARAEAVAGAMVEKVKNMSAEELIAFAKSKAKAGASAKSSGINTVVKYQEIMAKGAEMSQKPQKILDEARQAIYDLWNNGYKINYDAASKNEQAAFAKYGEDPDKVTEYTAAKLQVYKVVSEFQEKSYVLWRNAVLEAMTFLKTDYLLYTRQLAEDMKQMGNLAAGQDMEVALMYLRQALALRDMPNPIHE